MVTRLATHLLIRPEDVRASIAGWEVIGTFNPGVIRYKNETLILVRVAERPREKRSDSIALPRWSAGEFIIDWIPENELHLIDSRVVRRRDDGTARLTFISHLRVARSLDGVTIDSIGPPVLQPAEKYEEYGIEDPRITLLDGRYYITYVAVSRHGAATSLVSTSDFQTFTRHGIIFCPENKDVVLFPEKIRGEYAALHRPVGGTPFSNPQMWVAHSPDLFHWGKHRYLYGGDQDWETGRVGAGAPPIAIAEGWLEVYHANRHSTVAGKVGEYCGGAMLLDLDNPGQILGIGQEPILQPEFEFEREGFVNDVVFPTAVLEREGRLLVYYGASDRYTAVAELPLRDVLDGLSQLDGSM